MVALNFVFIWLDQTIPYFCRFQFKIFLISTKAKTGHNFESKRIVSEFNDIFIHMGILC